MSIEILYDLIKQVKTEVLNETNFSSYDPDDASFPDLPSLESSISELDPSPPHLRCKHCKGRLLSGVNSLICVFCGKQRAPQEAPPEPITFNTTFGCRWLLDSLGLDGSETVALPVQENESNRGQNATQEEFPLSDLLDLEITWNSNFDKLGAVSNQSYFNLAGVNPDNFFAERNQDDASAVSVEQSLPIKNDNGSGNDDFQVRDNVRLFENVQSSETAVRSFEDESEMDCFGGWEANFQSTGAGTSHGESKLVDPVVESSVDLSGQMDEVFGSGKDKEGIFSCGSRSNDWFQDDQFSSYNSDVSGQSKQVEMTANEMDGRTMQNANNNSSSMSVDWIQDGQWQSESKEAPDNKAVDELDDSFNTWNDFASSTPAENPSEKQTSQAKQLEETAIVEGGGKVENTNNSSSRNVNWFQDDPPHTISTGKQGNKAIDEENDAFNDWNDFASSTTAQDPYSGQTGQTNEFEMIDNVKDGKEAENYNSSSLNVDWFQDYEWQTNCKKGLDNKTVDVADDFVDSWNDFTSSTSVQAPSKKQTGEANLFEVTTTVKDGGKVVTADNSSSIALIQDDQLPTISNQIDDSKGTDEGDDLFDTWNDFKSSTTAQDSTNKQIGQDKYFEANANVDHGIMEVSNSSFDWFQGDQRQTSSNKAPDSKFIDEDPDSFDAWNGFKRSTNAQDPSNKQSVNHVTPSVEQTSDVRSSPTNNNLQNVDFGSFLEQRIFSGASSNQNGSSELNIMMSEPSVSNRISDVNAKDGVNAGKAKKGGDILNATKRSTTTDDVGTLMSQMHDLSFMLSSNLSVPPKQR